MRHDEDEAKRSPQGMRDGGEEAGCRRGGSGGWRLGDRHRGRIGEPSEGHG